MTQADSPVPGMVRVGHRQGAWSGLVRASPRPGGGGGPGGAVSQPVPFCRSQA